MFNSILNNKKWFNLILVCIFLLTSSLGILLAQNKPANYQAIFVKVPLSNYSSDFNLFTFETFINSNEFQMKAMKNIDYTIHINYGESIISVKGKNPSLIFNDYLKKFKVIYYANIEDTIINNFQDCIKFQNIKIMTDNFYILKDKCERSYELYGDYDFHNVMLNNINNNYDSFTFREKTNRQVSGVTFLQGIILSTMLSFFLVFSIRFMILNFIKH